MRLLIVFALFLTCLAVVPPLTLAANNDVDWLTVAVSAAAAAIVGTIIAVIVVWLHRRREEDHALCAAGRHLFQHPRGFYSSPIAYCTRHGCNKQAVTMFVAPDVAWSLHNAIPPELRWPPVHLDAAGNAYPLEGIDPAGYVNTSPPPEADPVGTVYASDGDRWVPAEPIPVRGLAGRLEATARRRGWARLAGRLAAWDERTLGR